MTRRWRSSPDRARRRLRPARSRRRSSGPAGDFPGLSLNFTDDHEMLRHGMVIYDALYAWCGGRPADVAARLRM